jgi:FKBP-type peptidyl-prolyl cis-trans isomerase
VFDSSVGKPHRVDGFYFQLGAGGVIKGWEVGFAAMTVGEEAVLTIAPEYGYGARGGSGIPGGATLVFDVVLLDAKDMTDSELAAQDAKVARLRG